MKSGLQKHARRASTSTPAKQAAARYNSLLFATAAAAVLILSIILWSKLPPALQRYLGAYSTPTGPSKNAAARDMAGSTPLQAACLVRPVVVLFGDSLTQYSHDPEGGWGAALAHHLQRRADVLNRGLAGYNSAWGRQAFEHVLAEVAGCRVGLLTIWLGANDAAIPGRSAEVQAVPLSEYVSNLRAMVDAARQAGNIERILLLTPPPVHDEGRVRHQQQVSGVSTPVLPNKSLQHTQQYAQAVLDLGRELQLPVVDLYSRLQAVPDWQTVVLKDGLHFTPAGSMAVWRELKAVIDEQLPQLKPESLPVQFPLWDQLDHANYEQHWRDTLPALAAASRAAGDLAAVGAAADHGRPLVVLFGDSLTQYSHDPEGGWGAALAHHLQRRVDVLSRGHSGYNSRWVLKVFTELLAQLAGCRVGLLTIWLGANDAAIPGRSAEVQAVLLSEYVSNLRAMVDAARQAGNIERILLLTPPPVHDEGRVRHQQQKNGSDAPVPPDRSLQHTQQYAQAVLDLGRELQLPVVDLYSRLQAVPDWQTVVLKDGLHFTPAGSMAVWRELKAVIDKQLPHLSPEALPAQFPVWDSPDHATFQQQWQALSARGTAEAATAAAPVHNPKPVPAWTPRSRNGATRKFSRNGTGETAAM